MHKLEVLIFREGNYYLSNHVTTRGAAHIAESTTYMSYDPSSKQGEQIT